MFLLGLFEIDTIIKIFVSKKFGCSNCGMIWNSNTSCIHKTLYNIQIYFATCMLLVKEQKCEIYPSLMNIYQNISHSISKDDGWFVLKYYLPR